jgi:hypothetical protein
MSQIRSNPPESVNTFEQKQMYMVLYDDMTDNGVLLQYHDRHALGELAVINCEMNDLRADLRKNGESVEVQGDRNVVTKKNPARDALEKIRPHQIRLMKEFKMTPNSRKVTSGVPEHQGDKDDGFGIV